MTRGCRIRATRGALLIVLSVAVVQPTAGQDPRTGPRVRSHTPQIVDAIARGTAASPTLRRLIDNIDATDGIVYVDDGQCGHSVRACFIPTVLIAGPNRVLRILMSVRKAPGCELVEVIGHELQHAMEILGDPRIRTDLQVHNFFDVIGRHPEAGRFETSAARQVAVAISREACRR
jgi:hypothetical protein